MVLGVGEFKDYTLSVGVGCSSGVGLSILETCTL